MYSVSESRLLSSFALGTLPVNDSAQSSNARRVPIQLWESFPVHLCMLYGATKHAALSLEVKPQILWVTTPVGVYNILTSMDFQGQYNLLDKLKFSISKSSPIVLRLAESNHDIADHQFRFVFKTIYAEVESQRYVENIHS
jgi:hypothetical protein